MTTKKANPAKSQLDPQCNIVSRIGQDIHQAFIDNLKSKWAKKSFRKLWQMDAPVYPSPKTSTSSFKVTLPQPDPSEHWNDYNHSELASMRKGGDFNDRS